MLNRRSFLQQSFGFLSGLAAGPVILDKLCTASVATYQTSAGALFAAVLNEGETHILDMLEGPAEIYAASIYCRRLSADPTARLQTRSPVFCRLYREGGTGDLLNFTLHPLSSLYWQAGPDRQIIVPAGQRICLIAETKEPELEIVGTLFSPEKYEGR